MIQTRDSAGLVISTLVENKPKLIGKKGLVPHILESMIHIIATSDTSAAGSLFLAMEVCRLRLAALLPSVTPSVTPCPLETT